MTATSRFEAVAATIRDVSPGSASLQIQEATLLVEELGLDSLDLVSLLMRIQDDFQVELDLDQVGRLRTMADVMELLEQQLLKAA